jgi:DNA modification methylase
MPGARRIEYLPLSSLQGAKSNPKAHDDANIQASVSRFGFVDPPTLDERTGRLVGGHGRRDALLALKAAGSAAPAGIRVERDDWYVPVLRGWASENDAAADAFLLASNQLTMAGGWDESALSAMLADLSKIPESLAGVGFSEKELVSFLASLGRNEGQCDPDDAPEPEDDTYVKAGELWLLGKHRILCGDCTDPDVVARVLGGEKAQACWTDPPFGVEYKGGTAKHKTISNDDAEGLPALLRDAFARCAEALIEGGAIYVAHPAGALSAIFVSEFMGAGFRLHETLIWVKDVFVLGHSDYHYRHEPILFGYSPGGGRRGRGGEGWYGDNAQDSVIEIPRPKKSEEHPTMKPVELVERCLGNSTAPGHLVFEPFSGSGTTLIACERLGRRCSAIELEPRYVQVAIERWKTFTGQEATCEGAPKVRRARTKPAPEPKPTLALLPAKSDVRTPDAPPSASDVDTDAIPF